MTFCRYCGGRVFMGDAHPCCARWMGLYGHARCLACDASKAFKRRAVLTSIQPDVASEVERVEWRGLTIRQQFPWTRPHRSTA